MTKHAVLWDLDGTLVDSAQQHWQAWHATLLEEGVHVTQAEFLETFGWRNDAILARFLGPHISEIDVRRIAEAKETRFRQTVAKNGLVALPGAKEWLVRLRQRGWRQAVASSAPRANVEVVTTALGIRDLFDAVVTAEDVRLGKPEPDVFLKAAAKLGVEPPGCVVVEDAAAGIEAATRAGMASIGIGLPDSVSASLVVASLLDLADDVFERLVKRHAAK